MRNKELKPEDVEASHTLGGEGEGVPIKKLHFLPGQRTLPGTKLFQFQFRFSFAGQYNGCAHMSLHPAELLQFQFQLSFAG